MIKFVTTLLTIVSFAVFAQKSSVTDQERLLELYQQFRTKEVKDSINARLAEQSGNVKVTEISESGDLIGLVGFDRRGFPVFYTSDNSNAAATVGTNLVVAGAPNGYGLTGNGMVIGEWDGGSVLGTHQELTGRVTQIDNPSSNSDHATHVAGTMIASGVVSTAKGMATAATLQAHDFYNDDSEMTTFAATGKVSNHSYGRITGWREMNNGTWRWYGDTTISGTEDYMFGFYSTDARNWDLIANAAPNYLIVKSAGNDRNDVPSASVTTHDIYYNGSWIPSTISRPQDGGTTGYDCISSTGNAKNILTVGAVGDISGGYSQPSDVVMSSFSGWGPTDDGRIKPDIVANGIGLYSSGSANNTDYYSSNGTSMSAPNTTGSIALLQEMYNDSNNTFMNASSLKALVIHTANEAGLTGPDFQFGWGLLNIKGAADIIADTVENKIIETTLNNNGTRTYTFYSDGTSDIEATIVWNDPAGSSPWASLDPTTSVLVNDLDLRISNGSGTIRSPWIVNSATPSVAATTGDNVKDNVEKVVFASPTAGLYTFTVTHKGSLTPSQNFSLIISGLATQPTGPAPVASFTSSATTICEGDSILFTDTSTGSPTSLEWTFTGGTPLSSTSSTPSITYTTAGIYEVKLKATNVNGVDSIVQVGYITVNAVPVVSTSALPGACMFSGTGLIPLTGGMPTGGTWSGNGVINNSFDPMVAGVGTFPLTYTVTNGGCTGSSTENITVTISPTVSLPSFNVSVCDNSAPFTLFGGTPVGGTYSGTGVSNNTFDASVAGLGTHTITYTYVDSNGCSGSATTVLYVLPGIATSLAPFTDVCDSSTLVALTGGTPLGGFYSGVGVDSATATFDPAIAGPGTHTITYFGSGGLCVSAANSTITVNPLPSVSIGSLSDQCLAVTSVALSGGSPAGGVYSGTAVTNGVFDPSAAGIGMHWIYYAYVDPVTSCSGVDSTTINVVNSIQFTLNDTTVCENTMPFVLNSGMPSGGDYSGVGVVGNTFDPAVAGVGSHTITYTDVVNACAMAGTAVYTVNPAPIVSLSTIPNICLTGGPVTLTGGMPTGGVYSGIGVSNNTIDPNINGAGNVNITYTYTSNGCSDSATQVAVIGMGAPEIVNIQNAYCINEMPVILRGNPAGGVFSGSGITDSIFDPSAAGVGSHNIVYTTTGGCAGTTSYTVQVNPKPTIGAVSGPLISSQNVVAGYNVTAQNGSYYNWIATGGSIVSNSNNQITVQWDTGSTGMLQVVMFDPNGCRDTANITVNLWPVGVQEVIAEGGLAVYPNPASESIMFNGDLLQGANIGLVVLNSIGQTVWIEHKNLSKGDFKWPIEISEWSTGTYFFLLQEDDQIIANGQFLKQ